MAEIVLYDLKHISKGERRVGVWISRPYGRKRIKLAYYISYNSSKEEKVSAVVCTWIPYGLIPFQAITSFGRSMAQIYTSLAQH